MPTPVKKEDYGNPEAFIPADIADQKEFMMQSDMQEDPELVQISRMSIKDRVSNVFTQLH